MIEEQKRAARQAAGAPPEDRDVAIKTNAMSVNGLLSFRPMAGGAPQLAAQPAPLSSHPALDKEGNLSMRGAMGWNDQVRAMAEASGWTRELSRRRGIQEAMVQM